MLRVIVLALCAMGATGCTSPSKQPPATTTTDEELVERLLAVHHLIRTASDPVTDVFRYVATLPPTAIDRAIVDRALARVGEGALRRGEAELLTRLERAHWQDGELELTFDDDFETRIGHTRVGLDKHATIELAIDDDGFPMLPSVNGLAAGRDSLYSIRHAHCFRQNDRPRMRVTLGWWFFSKTVNTRLPYRRHRAARSVTSESSGQLTDRPVPKQDHVTTSDR